MSEVNVVKGDDGKVQVHISETPEQKEEVLTADEAESLGLSPEEIELGKEVGEVVPEKSEEDKKKESEESAKKAESDKKKVEKSIEKSGEETEEEEHQRLSKESPAFRGQYFKMKEERTKRQAAEKREEDLKARLKAAEEREALVLKARKDEPEKEDEEEDLFEGKEDGDIMTVAEYRELEKKKAEKAKIKADKEAEIANREKAEREERATKLKDKILEQEVGARARYGDFDNSVKFAQDILNKRGEMLTDKRVIAEANLLLDQWRTALAKTLEEDNPDYNSSDIIYKLGQLHPDYKKSGGNGGLEGGKSMSAEDLKRAEENAGKGSASAGASSAGKRIVREDNLSVAEAVGMSEKEFGKLSPEAEERLLKGEST